MICGKILTPNTMSNFFYFPGKETLPNVPIRTINDLPTELLTRILTYFQDDISSLKQFSLISRPFLSVCQKYLLPPTIQVPPRTINDLPTELLTDILAYFQDDLSSLKTFSLISRPFLSVCRKYLFTTLRLNSFGSSFDSQCDSWMTILNNSIDLSSLQILELGPPILRLPSHAYSNHWNQLMERKVPSIHDQRVQTIIQRALNPHIVILRFEFQSWKDLSVTFQEAFIELVQRETVTSLSLEYAVDFPMAGLSRCRYLRELSLISFNISESVVGPGLFEDEVSGGSKGYLESLTLFASDECVETMINVLSSSQSLLDLTQLRRLSINSTGEDGRLAMKKIPLIARCITILELRVGGKNGMYLFFTIHYPPFFSIKKE